MLLIDAIPALVTAALILLFLPERIETASWLSGEEKDWLRHHHAADHAASGAVQHDFWRTLTNPVALGIGLTCALVFLCLNAVSYSAPKLLMQATGLSLGTVGFASALTQIPVALAMLVIGWHSDHCRAPHLHIATMIARCAVGAVGMALAFQAGSGEAVVAIFAAYCLFNAAGSVVGTLAMPTASGMLHPENRAVAFAAINTIAEVGNFLGPFLWGFAADRTGSFQLGLSAIPLILLPWLGLILTMRRSKKRTALVAAKVGR